MNMIVHWTDYYAFRYGLMDSLAQIKRGVGDIPDEKASAGGLDV